MARLMEEEWPEPLAAFVALANYPGLDDDLDDHFLPIVSHREAWVLTERCTDHGQTTREQLWQQLYGQTPEEFFGFDEAESGDSASPPDPSVLVNLPPKGYTDVLQSRVRDALRSAGRDADVEHYLAASRSELDDWEALVHLSRQWVDLR
jgi:hypothetical protein